MVNKQQVPEGWEPCNPSECTHVWVMLYADMLPAVKNLDRDMSVRINGEWISEQNWPILGIIPIRKVPPPDPIEFVLGEPLITKHECEDSYGITSEYTRTSFELPKSVRPGMRFREVLD